ncbi:MAG: leucine-rich repeat domain-containing protein [Bacteroidetes bacterium]|nr:MAG: leucine-rich repeat domain-containing protein [Bacteroidota bacterium]
MRFLFLFYFFLCYTEAYSQDKFRFASEDVTELNTPYVEEVYNYGIINIDLLEKCPKLRKIKFDGYKNPNITFYLGNLKQVKHIILYGFAYTEIPCWIHEIIELEQIELEFNRIPVINSHVFKHSSLKKLNIAVQSSNFVKQLTLEVPTEINVTLNELDLSANKLVIPDNFFCFLPRLKKLKLVECKGGLPISITCLKELEYLDISKSDITSLPDDIDELLSIKKLILKDTKITKLPESIHNLKNLEELNMLGTNICTTNEERIAFIEKIIVNNPNIQIWW